MKPIELRPFHTNGKNQTYYVSDTGRVFKELGQTDNGDGYLQIHVPTAPKKRVHQLVAEAFLGPCPKGMQPDHKNGNRADNRVENLEYVTIQENIRRGWQRGRRPMSGELNGNSRLSAEDVDEIRNILRRKTGKRHGPKITDIAERFGVSKATISYIWREATWKQAA